MKRLFIHGLVLFLSSGGWGAIAYVGGNLQVSQTGDPFTTSAYIGTTGNIVAIGVFWKGAVTISGVTCSACVSTCVDSGAGRLSRPTDGFMQIYYCPNITGGSSTYAIDFSGAPTGGETHVWKDEFSGVATVAPVETTATGTATSGSAVTTGNLVTTTANDVIYAFGVGNNAALYTVGTNFTACQLQAAGEGGSEYRLVTPGTYTATLNMPTSISKAGIIGVAFKESGAAAASVVCPSTEMFGIGCGL